jgi:drug/metabolite transporter (DMT)-like permease
MRHWLTVLGAFLFAFGLLFLFGRGLPHPTSNIDGFLILAGALLFGLAGATSDIVAAIKGSRLPQREEEQGRP